MTFTENTVLLIDLRLEGKTAAVGIYMDKLADAHRRAEQYSTEGKIIVQVR